MKYFKSFSESLKNMGHNDFERLALDLFHFQAAENPVYKAYIQARKIDPKKISNLTQIPFLPISFFKSQKVYCGSDPDPNKFYSSSGTTGQVNSKHYYWSETFYLEHAKQIFEETYGSLSDFHILALLPSYLERQGSSLVSMIEYFISQTKSPFSGFYLYDHQKLSDTLTASKSSGKKVLLIGVTFALLDLIEEFKEIPALNNLIVMETGGMKGRRKEMIREEVHDQLRKGFQIDAIHSEYGMTELMSQAYSKSDGIYTLPKTMGVYIRDTHDPFAYQDRKVGGMNIIDLANFHSCAFIETQDLGRIDRSGELEILGRFDNSDLRGCNLMLN
ncbi:LuxE/PaaK family acyltransferase [Lunatibacter salilacus]|uniref:LuxE/PaaK family acyltransferase n=1 Tax=Lunatibacter salilacus TaxID=2483804 RepID=UPI00131ABEA8|nr:acyl transferase [Lunatibacter salilacus]